MSPTTPGATDGRRGLLERMAEGPLLCAEGYVFELERRGYLQAGGFVPEVVLDHPEVLAQLHRDFLHAGSDVVEALTYYAHREKLRAVGQQHLLEPLNRQALAIAGEVAADSGALVAGNLSNSNVFEPDDQASGRLVRQMFDEQLGWAVDAGVDYVIAETFSYAQEALIALELIKRTPLPAVITLAVHRAPRTREGWPVDQACRRLADAGADVVGLNCARGPRTMLPLLAPVTAVVDVPVAALPVPYRTHDHQPSFQSLRDPDHDRLPADRPFPTALDPFTCTRYEIADFTRTARELGVAYLGLCCGAGPHHVRAMAEALGRTPPASRYSPDMSRHAFLGADRWARPADRRFSRDY
ncbi:MAG: homocysteine S-methyltransferase family protein [Actinobacteria bacterium]|nr:homocysteine S-methyltransferase family protein [Actinomycetota bacterium]